MSVRLASATVLLAAAVLGAGWSAQPADAASHRATRTYLSEGHSAADRRYEPRTITLSGDSTLFLEHGHWHRWTATSASGSVRSGWNDCVPDCARGTVHWFLTKASLSRPRLVCGHEFFTRVRFHFTHGRPHGIPQNDVYDATPAGAC